MFALYINISYFIKHKLRCKMLFKKVTYLQKINFLTFFFLHIVLIFYICLVYLFILMLIYLVYIFNVGGITSTAHGNRKMTFRMLYPVSPFDKSVSEHLCGVENSMITTR